MVRARNGSAVIAAEDGEQVWKLGTGGAWRATYEPRKGRFLGFVSGGLKLLDTSSEKSTFREDLGRERASLPGSGNVRT